MTVQERELIVFDENMDPVGRIKNAESFTFTENWYEPHTWELKIDAAKIDLYEMMTDIQTQHHIGFLSDDGTVKIGIIEDVKKPSGASGEQWTISGRGILALLERRKLMNGYSTATGFDVTTGSAFQMIQHVALDQADPHYLYLVNTTAYRYYALKIADNWGATTVITIRRVELQSGGDPTFTSQYPPAHSDTYVKATSKYSTGYWPYFATDPALSLTGAQINNTWASLTGSNTNQRFHIDLGSAKIITRIYYHNAHHSGALTNQGAKNITVWGSNTAGSFADLTYGTDTGWTQILQTPAYETAMRHYVDTNAGPNAKGVGGAADTNRVITGLSLAAVDYGRGGACNFQGRAQSLLDTLTEFNKSSELSCDLVWSGAAAAPTARYTFVFTVYASTDMSDEVILTADLGNVLSYDYQESVLGYRNTIYVAGTGTAAARVLSKIYSGAEPTGRDRFEDYIDATDCTTTDQLTQRGNETLSLKAGTESLEFVFDTENQSEVYGVDFKCGDIVTVIDPDVATLVDRITSVTTTYDENGKTIKLGMGTSAPDLVSILKMDRKQNTGVRR